MEGGREGGIVGGREGERVWSGPSPWPHRLKVSEGLREREKGSFWEGGREGGRQELWEGGICLGLDLAWPCNIGSPRGWPHAWTAREWPPSGARRALHPWPPLYAVVCVCSRWCVLCRRVPSVVAVVAFVVPVVSRPLCDADSRTLGFLALSGSLCRTDTCQLGFHTLGRPPSGRLGATIWWA